MGLDEALVEVRNAVARYGAAERWRSFERRLTGASAEWAAFESALQTLVFAARAERPLSHEAVAAMEAG